MSQNMLGKPSNHEITGRQLRLARAVLGLSQIELADLTGVSTSTIRRIEAKDAEPTGGLFARALSEGVESKGIVILKPGDVAPGDGVAEAVL
jgi:transcriptional regulator with XRE-family HTH domain